MKYVEISDKKSRLTGIRQAATRLRKSPYQTMRLIACGVLESELVDGTPKVTIASIERLEAVIAGETQEPSAA
jgi:hypothetical protein